ncbi:hypothetical protein G7Z17_g3875 [Cylindrodendrum hubeiense]|uniref:Uncharacterized protein n=1 Tax=Cylindrodendrum hubeiense TaxID=595255 RepID=A0A9P5LJI9_9HYPO|nr:hypothetical protein G7Z17_g3875 [Cylindrodendrum hubeiense]
MNSAPFSTVSVKPDAWKLELPTLAGQVEATLFAVDGFQTEFASIVGQEELPPVALIDRQATGMHRYLVKIESRFVNKATGLDIWKIGAGWLIRPDLLVTAGNVVFDTEYQLGAATQVKCYIGYGGRDSSETSQIQSRYGQSVVTSAEWADQLNTRSRDITFIQVAEPFAIDICTCGSFNDIKIDEPAPVDAVSQPTEAPAIPVIPAIPEIEEKLNLTVTHCDGCGGSCGSSAVTPAEQPEIQEEVKPVEETPVIPSGTTETDFEIVEENTPTTSEEDESNDDDLFYEVLKTVANLDTTSLDSTSSLLDPASKSVSITAGALLSYVVGAEAISSGAVTKIPGAAERALLAEASLQAVLAIEESPELDEILEHMQQNWTDKAPEVDEAAGLLASYLKEAARDIATYRPTDNEVGQSTKRKRRALPIRNLSTTTASGTGKDFIKGLFGPTVPLAGREDVFSSLGPVLKSAISAVEELVSESGKTAVVERVPKLLEKAASRGIELSSGPDEEASRILLQRAVMADAALQAILSLSQEKLQALKLLPLDTVSVEEDIFDFLKRVVQDLGPLALYPAKHGVKTFTPLLIDAPAKPQPVEKATVKTAKNKLVLREMLRGAKPSVIVL